MVGLRGKEQPPTAALASNGVQWCAWCSKVCKVDFLEIIEVIGRKSVCYAFSRVVEV